MEEVKWENIKDTLEQGTKAAESLIQNLVGLGLAAAKTLASKNHVAIRDVSNENEAHTTDYCSDRINVVVKDNIITSAFVGWTMDKSKIPNVETVFIYPSNEMTVLHKSTVPNKPQKQSAEFTLSLETMPMFDLISNFGVSNGQEN